MSRVLRYSAFADEPGGGNPAGIVLDAADLDDAAMLAVAADVGYSETAFLVPARGDGRTFAVRYFSPRIEVPFCGHATIAAGVALAERLGTGRFALRTAAGEVVVDTESDSTGALVATLTSIPPTSRPATADELDPTLQALGWTRAELDDRHPPHVAGAGNDHLILAAATRERLAALTYDSDELGAVMAHRGWLTLQLVFAERPDLFHARNPFPLGGIFEDPATGSAAAALGGYLRALDRLPDPPRVTVLQGVDLGRPSRLVVDIPRRGGIRVTGTALAIPPEVQ